MNLLDQLLQHTYSRKYALGLVAFGVLLLLGVLAALLPALGPHVVTLAGSVVAVYATFVTGHVFDPSSQVKVSSSPKPEAQDQIQPRPEARQREGASEASEGT